MLTLALLVTLTQTPDDVARAVDAALTRGALTTTTHRDCAQELSVFEVSRDATGLIRRLVWSFGSEDSSHRAENTYDAKGRLRLVVVDVGAVPSVKVKARFSFDRAGKLTSQSRKVSGEGFLGYATEPGEYAVPSPTKLLAARTGCDAG
jgi:hypothetical protein